MQNQKVAPFSSKYAPNQKVGCESFYRIELEAMWEKLYVFLHQLKRRFFVLSTNWNADLMSRGQADAEDDEETRGLIMKVTVALRFPGMHAWIVFLLTEVRVVCLEVAWLERCFCHPVANLDDYLPGHKRHIGEDRFRCPWSGRRIVEVLMGRPDVAIENISTAG